MGFKDHVKNSFGLNNFGHAYNDIYFFIIPLLLPFLRAEFDLSYSQAGLILTSHIGFRSLFSYISGHFGDRYDKRYILSIGFLLASVIMVSLIWANSIITITIILMFLGMAISSFHPLATAMAGEEADPEHRALHIGIFEGTGALGLVIASFSFGFFVQIWGWRQTCLFLALPGFILAFLYLRMKKEEIDHTLDAEEEVDKFYIILFIIARGVRALGVGAISSFLTTFGSDYLGFSASSSAWLVTLFFLGCLIGGLVGGWYSDKTTPLLVILASNIIIIPVIIIMTYVLNPFLAIILILLLGFMNSSYFTTQNCWLTTVSTASTRGKVMGAAFLIDGLTITISPTLFGWIADNVGLAGSYRWAVVPILISVILFFRLYNLKTKGELDYRGKKSQII